jgi:cobalt-zinc-cadmium efflux system outer membrane protein
VATVAIRSAARDRRERALSYAERARRAREDLVPLRARLVRETLREYNAMQIGAFDVLAARRLELAAGREALELLEMAWLARLDLEELCAGAFGGHTARAEPSGHDQAPAETSGARGH